MNDVPRFLTVILDFSSIFKQKMSLRAVGAQF